MAIPGTKPKPTAVKEMEGAFVNQPGRRNEHEPILSVERPECPDHVKADPVAFAKWKEVVGWLEEMRVLAIVDRDLISNYATIYSQLEANTIAMRSEDSVLEGTRGTMVRNPRTQVLSDLRTQSLKLLVEMGLTPSSRSRLKAAPKEDDGMLTELMKRRESLN